MRAPPPVDYPSALTRTWRTLLSLVVGASVASLMAWALPYLAAQGEGRQAAVLLDAVADPVLQAALAMGVGGVVAAVVWLSWKSGSASERTLRWDGQDWVLRHSLGHRSDERGDAALMLDLGPWMLVRFLPRAGTGSATWLPLAVGIDPARWAALRGALWNWRDRSGDARP